MAEKTLTQAQRIAEYLADHGSITTYEAFRHLGITRLSARIFDMRERGWEFKRTTETRKNKYGIVSFTRYEVLKEGAVL